jgi:hypothetical protein
MSTVNKAVGLLFGLAIVAVIAAKPGFLATTFTGTSNVIRAATGPVTGK